MKKQVWKEQQLGALFEETSLERAAVVAAVGLFVKILGEKEQQAGPFFL